MRSVKNNKPDMITDASDHYPGKNNQSIYVGQVKDNRDIRRNGSLMVYVPELSGSAPSDRNGWIKCHYASPFAGSTPLDWIGNDHQSYVDTQSSYGFWAVPPDINNQVLIALAVGKTTRAYWFACIPEAHSHNMVPAVTAKEPNKRRDGFYDSTNSESTPLPVAEYNKLYSAVTESFRDENRPIQPYLSAGLRKSGLIHDQVRGPTSVGSMTSNAAEIYGMNTPGPRITDPAADAEYYAVKGNKPSFSQSKSEAIYKSTTKHQLDPELEDTQEIPIRRKGGSQFVLSDEEGSEFVRLRTRSGAQIYIGETDGIVYINNRDGNAWIQLSETGNVDIFSAKSVSVRSHEDLNLRADRDINIEAGRDMQLKAAKDYKGSDKGEVAEELEGAGGNIKIQANNDYDIYVENDLRSDIKKKSNFVYQDEVKTEYRKNTHTIYRMDSYTYSEANVTVKIEGNSVTEVDQHITTKTPSLRVTGDTTTIKSSGSTINMAGSIGITTDGTVGVTSSGKSTIDASEVGLNAGKIGLQGTTHLAGSVLAQNVKDTLDGNGAPNFLAAVVSPGASGAGAAGTGSDVNEEMVVDPVEPDEIQLAELNEKYNVLGELKPDGNKVFSLSYMSEEIKTIVKRFMTREPCREHENTGDVEKWYPDYKTDKRG